MTPQLRVHVIKDRSIRGQCQFKSRRDNERVDAIDEEGIQQSLHHFKSRRPRYHLHNRKRPNALPYTPFTTALEDRVQGEPFEKPASPSVRRILRLCRDVCSGWCRWCR